MGKKLTKEQAHEMYDHLHKAMGHMLTQQDAQPTASPEPAKSQAATQANGKAAYAASPAKAPAPNSQAKPANKRRNFDGQAVALMAVAFLGCAKIGLSALTASGFGRVEEAQAVVVKAPVGPKWTKEEALILKALDGRRVELEERGARLDKREEGFAVKERELAVRLTELKDLTERLKLDREKSDNQRNTQLDQLANVYGSMNPPEAAQLLQQLDIQVCLSLIERLPEKRMAQILALMNPERALELTNLLSKRKA
jgi:flagellar motility protein MotE (MotC chaperone)